MKITLLFCFLFLNACSMYRSNGRKQLESDAASGKGQIYQLKSCQKINSVQAWIQSEFPAQTNEIVVSESDLEILKATLPNGQVLITATQIDGDHKTSCQYTFANEQTWNAHQKEFIEELENNMMTTE